MITLLLNVSGLVLVFVYKLVVSFCWVNVTICTLAVNLLTSD